MDWYPMLGIPCIPLGTSPRRGGRPGKPQRDTRLFTTTRATSLITEVRTMASCIACGAELEPPVRAPHTVYVKTLYRIAGQDYCRHHITRAAVAAGLIVEVKPRA